MINQQVNKSINILIFFASLTIFLLSGCKKNKPLEFSEKLIIKYQTDTIPKHLDLDTMYLILENEINIGKTGDRRWQKKGDTLGSLTFDENGRLLSDAINPFEDFDYHYDSLGLVDHVRWRDWDIIVDFLANYSVSKDSLTIIQRFVESPEKTLVLTYHYKFNSKGLLIKKETPAQSEKILWNSRIKYRATNQLGVLHDTTEHKTIYKYFYNSKNQIDRIETWSDSKLLTGRSSNEIYYYSTQLDSTILTYDHLKYQIKRYFNKSGLEQRRIYSDSIKLKFIYQ